MLSYGHLKFFEMAAGRHLGFDPTGNGAVRSAVTENPTLEPNIRESGDALLSYGHLKFFTLGPENGHRILETGHTGDFIFCQMLLCSELDRQKVANIAM